MYCTSVDAGGCWSFLFQHGLGGFMPGLSRSLRFLVVLLLDKFIPLPLCDTYSCRCYHCVRHRRAASYLTRTGGGDGRGRENGRGRRWMG